MPPPSTNTDATDPSNSSTSGITINASGSRLIPSSTRADGSTRKEIRIRPGYRPPEDVEVYKNRTAEAWKTRGSGGVPGAAGLKEEGGAGEDGKATSSSSSSSAKNAKRREARKKAAKAVTSATTSSSAPAGGAEDDDGEHGAVNGDAATATSVDTASAEPQDHISPAKQANGSGTTTAPTTTTTTVDDEAGERANREKQARKLKKKLREARELQAKKEQGEGLLQEQFEKVIKIKELIRDLEKLGFQEEEDVGNS